MRKDHKEYREGIKILRLENEKLRSEQEKVKKENEEIKKEILRLRNSMDHLERGKRERNIVLTGLQIDKGRRIAAQDGKEDDQAMDMEKRLVHNNKVNCDIWKIGTWNVRSLTGKEEWKRGWYITIK
ncbi:hypothetical protein QE152_g31946 [Popillia japonica]|uniref:Uncharacterized protein n=1 Tax=Popillia japonica TaxID=7064 RepID=A0AAW1J0V8_POPJA